MQPNLDSSPPLRIDLVITELDVGGAEKCLTELAIRLARAGDLVRVISIASLPEGEGGFLVERLRREEIPVESLEADSAWACARAWKSLRRSFWESPPEIVQTFLHHANVLGIHAAKSAGVAVRVAGLRVAQPRTLRCLVERAALVHADRVVCVSRGVERFAQARLGCTPGSTVVIPNGVDLDRFASAKPFAWTDLGWPVDSQVCLFLGRLDPQKGIELLQQQIERLAPPGSTRKLLLAGAGPLRSGLEAWSDQIGPQRVRLLPWQPDVAPLLAACRLLVLPSHYEGMPNVVLEAMAAGKPVVCSRVEGSEELLAASGDDQGFAVGNSSEMADRIERFQSDFVHCQRVGRQNQQHVREGYSLAAMADAYRHLYRTLLARRREVV